MAALISFPRLIGTVLLTSLTLGTRAQQQMGIGTTTPNTRAALDITSASKGLLIPRLTKLQRRTISTPPQGLMVFQTSPDSVGFWYATGVGNAWLWLPDVATARDNLGNHTATRNLNLGANRLVGNGGTTGLSITTGGTVQVQSLAGTGTRLLTTDAAGNLAAAPLPTSESTTASNGLTLAGTDVRLGGALTTATTVAQGANPLGFTGTGGVAVGSATPAASAQLDVASTTKGFLPPRLTTAQRDAIAAPADGLTIYNTTTDCLESFVNGRWRNYCNTGNCDPTTTPGSIVAALGPICITADPPLITSTLAPSGGLNPWTYAWQQSTDGGTTWANIPGATALTYDPPTALPVTTQFRRVELNPCGSVYYTNACTISSVAPLVIGPITGPPVNTLCNVVVGNILTFSVAPVAGAIGYDVQLPPSLTLLRTIPGTTTVRFSIRVDSLVNTSISISAISAYCGNSEPSTLLLNFEPPTVGPITPGSAFCEGSTNVTFSVPDDPGVTAYTWVGGPGVTFVSRNRNVAVVNLPTGRTTTSISVRAVNTCGLSAFVLQTLPLGGPSTFWSINGPASLSRTEFQAAYSVSSLPPPSNYNVTYTWSLRNGSVPNLTLSNTTGPTVTLLRGVPSGFGTVTLVCTASNACGTVEKTRLITFPR